MPLLANCIECGELVFILRLQEGDTHFIMEYECQKCKKTFFEEIKKDLDLIEKGKTE